MAAGFSLKDQLFNAEKVRYLAGLFAQADTGFDSSGFQRAVMARLPDLELKERINLIADVLAHHLPADLPDAAGILRAALPEPLDPAKTDDDFGDFIFAPLGEFVAAKGLEHHPDLSLDLIEDITQRFSMEWAIRPFLNRWPDPVLERMDDWAGHSNYHVRRLVSEGTRPRLPWGQGVSLPLEAPLHLLDRLHGDPTRYVTRSVANHVNDITRKDPGLAMDRLDSWARSERQTGKELGWITGHALRGLVKAGNPRAMTMLGYDPDAPVSCELALKTPDVRVGETLDLSCTISADRDTPVLVDYIVWFQKADGSQRPKVFKLKQSTVRNSQPLTLRKSHRMKGDATTFRLFPGQHRVEVQVNGRVRARAEFTLR